MIETYTRYTTGDTEYRVHIEPIYGRGEAILGFTGTVWTDGLRALTKQKVEQCQDPDDVRHALLEEAAAIAEGAKVRNAFRLDVSDWK